MQRLLGSARGNGLAALLIRAGAGAGALKAVSMALGLLVTVVLARGLGPAAFGQYAFVVAVVTALATPFGPALQQLVTREAATRYASDDGKRILALLRWGDRQVAVAATLVGLVIVCAGFWFGGSESRWPLVGLGVVALPFMGFEGLRAGGLAGLHRVVRAQFPQMLVRPVALLSILGILFAVDSLSAGAAVMAFVAATGLAFAASVALWRYARPLGRNTPETSAHKHWRSAWGRFTLLMVTGGLNAQLGLLFLGAVSSDQQVAALRVAIQGGTLVALPLVIVNMVIGPYLARAYHQGDKGQLQALSRRSAQVALAVAGPAALILIAWGGPLLGWALGSEYARIAAWPLAALVVGQTINVAFGSVGWLLNMTGWETDSIRGTVVGLAVHAALALTLIPPFGAQGGAIAMATGLVATNAATAFWVVRRLRIVPGPFPVPGRPVR